MRREEGRKRDLENVGFKTPRIRSEEPERQNGLRKQLLWGSYSVASGLGPRTRARQGARDNLWCLDPHKVREKAKSCKDLHHGSSRSPDLHISEEAEAQRGKVSSPESQSHPEPE